MLDANILSLYKLCNSILEDLGPQISDPLLSLQDKMRLYLLMDTILDQVKILTTTINKWQPEVAAEVTKEMQANGVDSMVVSGHKFTPTTKDYVNVAEGNRGLVVSWLKQNNPTLVREDYNANAYTSYVRSLLEAGQQPPPHTNVFSKPTLSVRKA